MGIRESISPVVVLGGTNSKDRQIEDYYASPLVSITKLFEVLDKLGIALPETIIEPSVGDGAIAKPLEEKGHKIIGYDIVDRGYPETIVQDFLTVNERPEEPIAMVANYPYKYILEHTYHSLNLLNDGEYLCSLAKIQFLETKGRRELFDKFPMKYVCVFSERIKCNNNGVETPGSSAICYCWYIWEKGFKGRPEILWI